ncbi:hypothetical protein OG455_18365 [Kitasatospora sp. NBC_01287]|uniref:hypothetical protein n=1 Tax=Kitasatospora sp. NBC_01287 TaxID=2903573 RepID=UPI00224D6813|nr:hypothetical protein [Kitasatospora sp. NBC_01287]MCX4747460.1 hypothetical protein [Kitasatospora sp. NBC_01287]
MTQPTTAQQHAAFQAAPAAIPAQRTTVATGTGPRPGVEAGQPTGWTAVRRGFAVIRGLRSLATVPARPQPGYGESDGQ